VVRVSESIDLAAIRVWLAQVAVAVGVGRDATVLATSVDARALRVDLPLRIAQGACASGARVSAKRRHSPIAALRTAEEVFSAATRIRATLADADAARSWLYCVAATRATIGVLLATCRLALTRGGVRRSEGKEQREENSTEVDFWHPHPRFESGALKREQRGLDDAYPKRSTAPIGRRRGARCK
jgi:hypothetical protein